MNENLKPSVGFGTRVSLVTLILKGRVRQVAAITIDFFLHLLLRDEISVDINLTRLAHFP